VATTDPQRVLEQIRAREPLFHRRELVHSAATFDRETSDDFWEVGASGRVHPRDVVRAVVLRRLAEQDDDDLVSEAWRTEEHRVRPLGEDTYLFTYVLHGQGRVTRRSTVWRHDAERGWHALYHQGTPVGGGP
jgi:hypothetical protein